MNNSSNTICNKNYYFLYIFEGDIPKKIQLVEYSCYAYVTEIDDFLTAFIFMMNGFVHTSYFGEGYDTKQASRFIYDEWFCRHFIFW